MIAARTLRAYLDTNYEACGVSVRVGHRSAAIDELLTRLGATCAVFVTAWNPRSRRMPEGWNWRMQNKLRQRLRRYRLLPACGSLREWREEHMLVMADIRVVARLARLFRQRGLVILRRGGIARLMLLG